MIIRRGGGQRRGHRPAQLQGMGFLEAALASPAVQQAATQTAGNLLTTVGEGLISLFGDDSPAPAPPPPPPKPAIPAWLPIAAVAAIAAALLLRSK